MVDASDIVAIAMRGATTMGLRVGEACARSVVGPRRGRSASESRYGSLPTHLCRPSANVRKEGASESAQRLDESRHVYGSPLVRRTARARKNVRRRKSTPIGSQRNVVSDRECILPRPAARGRAGDAEAIGPESIHDG